MVYPPADSGRRHFAQPFYSRLAPQGLLGRSLLIIIAPLVILQIVSAVIFYERHWANVSRHRANAVVGDLALVIELVNERPSGFSRAWVLDTAHASLGIQTDFVPGGTIANQEYTPSSYIERTLAQSLAGLARPFAIDVESVPDQILVAIQLEDGLLRASFNDKRLVSSTNRIFVLWMIGTSLVLIGLAAVFMRNQVRPIRRLAHAAENFGKGRNVAISRPSGASEVRQAAVAFIAMRDRILRQVEQQTQMLAGVSHDLRTPLTRMRLQLAMLERKPEIEHLEHDIVTMEAMIDGYLNFVRGDAGEKRRYCEVQSLLEEIVDDARRAGAIVELNSGPPMMLQLAPNAFKRCVGGLVKNATQHADRIVIGVGINAGAAEITIDDDGAGIAEHQREDVFRPFFRLDPARGGESGGPGLGLTIARDIARSHGGNVSLATSPLGGLRAKVQIPL